jgi:hypothetical protein
LEVDGAKAFTQSSANELINQALIELDNAHPTGSSGQLLKEMALSLIHRQV